MSCHAERVLDWLAGLDEAQPYPGPCRPGEERPTGEFRTAVDDDLLRQAVPAREFVEQAHDPCAASREVGQERRAFQVPSSTIHRQRNRRPVHKALLANSIDQR
jgi:hypothetical protein